MFPAVRSARLGEDDGCGELAVHSSMLTSRVTSRDVLPPKTREVWAEACHKDIMPEGNFYLNWVPGGQ